MTGNPKLIEALNARLIEERAAREQYRVHAAQAAHWGYDGLAAKIAKRYRTEDEHAEELTAQILFLGGTPNPRNIGPVTVGPDVAAMYAADLKAETDALARYEETIRLAADVGDAVTRKLLEHIAKEERRHIEWIERQQRLLADLGEQNYKATLLQ